MEGFCWGCGVELEDERDTDLPFTEVYCSTGDGPPEDGERCMALRWGESCIRRCRGEGFGTYWDSGGFWCLDREGGVDG